MNASLDRRFIQVAGLEHDKVGKATLGQILDFDKAHPIDSTDRVLLVDKNGAPICSVDFVPERMMPIRAAQALPDDAPAKPDPSKGDTVIRKVEPGELREAGQYSVIHDPDREVPPIDLPDYLPDEDDQPEPQRLEVSPWLLLAVALAFVAGGIAIGMIYGPAMGG